MNTAMDRIIVLINDDFKSSYGEIILKIYPLTLSIEKNE
tara:strand:- start:534 stop:650 length:117 start_codon:yes stop_codon:yes gene_type:complete